MVTVEVLARMLLAGALSGVKSSASVPPLICVVPV